MNRLPTDTHGVGLFTGATRFALSALWTLQQAWQHTSTIKTLPSTFHDRRTRQLLSSLATYSSPYILILTNLTCCTYALRLQERRLQSAGLPPDPRRARDPTPPRSCETPGRQAFYKQDNEHTRFHDGRRAKRYAFSSTGTALEGVRGLINCRRRGPARALRRNRPRQTRNRPRRATKHNRGGY